MSPILLLLEFVFVTAIVLAAIGMIFGGNSRTTDKPQASPYRQMLDIFAYQNETQRPPKS